MAQAGTDLWLQTRLIELTQRDGAFHAILERDGKRQRVEARNLVVATGGKSIPKMGATGLAYDIARQFGHDVTETRPALVPLTFSDQRFATISGVSLPVTARNASAGFDEALLFTHRGLSGPAILQISSYWREGDEVTLDLLPGASLAEHLKQRRGQQGKRSLTTELGDLLPARLVPVLAQEFDLSGNLADLSDKRIALLDAGLKGWVVKPSGSEGYRTAEVTLGGVDTGGLSSSSMMSKTVQGLYFIGESVDVTGWLGGFNFQWAWSSGVAAGSHIAATKTASLD
jgi:predicted Rossmann fold flavoprotein